MTQITMSEKTMQPENENQTTQTVDQSENSDSNCNKIFLNWICCKAQEGEEADSLPPKQPIDLGTNKTNVAETGELPGYLNRFGGEKRYKGDKNGSFSDGTSSDSGCSLNKSGSIGGKSISSEAINSECDSGLGSASDSGRRSKDQSDASEKSDGEKSDDVAIEQPSLTLEQIKANFGRKPKRTESTLSRFSSIFSNDGRRLTDVLVEEFRLNDRFSGLSMDRIWGGFMDGIKEEEEDGKGKSELETIDENMTPDTRAKRALNDKKNQRRRKRRPRKAATTDQTNKAPVNQASNKNGDVNWQKNLPQDWQDVLTI